MSKHTPGPYEVGISTSNIALFDVLAKVKGRAVRVGSVEGNDHAHNAAHPIASEEAAANARLFVAAPDLLAALEQLVADSECVDDHWDAAHAAIAKARG